MPKILSLSSLSDCCLFNLLRKMLLQLCNKLLHVVIVILACYKPANGALWSSCLFPRSSRSELPLSGGSAGTHTGGLQVPEEGEEGCTGANEALLQG